MVTKHTLEEQIVQRQAIKLKVDQIFVQHGQRIEKQNLKQEDLKQILFSGAAKIMQEKTDAVDFYENLDIDALIKEGKEKA